MADEIPTMSIVERLACSPSASSVLNRRRNRHVSAQSASGASSTSSSTSQSPSFDDGVPSPSSSKLVLARRQRCLSSSSMLYFVSFIGLLVAVALSASSIGVDAAASSSSSRVGHHGATSNSGCKAIGRCCRGKDSSCFTTGPRMASARRTADRKCYCDETCRLTRDCCADYQDYCTKRDCVVSDWGKWGSCSHECGVGVSERERIVETESTNGGQSCPPLKQKRVCIGTTCIAQRSILSKTYKETAKVLPAAFGTWRRHKLYDARQDIRRNLYANEMDKPEVVAAQKQGYCGRYRIVSVSHGCQIIPWVMSMMPVGGEVCAECQPEAMKTNLGHVCKGHGEVDKATRFTTPIKNYCYGTWQLLGEMTSTCSCSQNSTLIFV